jgi:DNA invertase Pin-like site-specific DNA recombinase
MTTTKILPAHLNRLAVVYVRQSSPQQVEENTESRNRQYQLAERAGVLGWPSQRCLVIDDDLGISGAQSYNRPGYQRLISLVALREVGIVFGLEVSRLARNCLDWYQLLELAATFDVLIADEDGLYDPVDFNDRMLLGLKGTFSEIERYQIRARMVRGRTNKARRGDLALSLPVGFIHDALTGEIRLSPDQAVRHTIELVFHLFAGLGSVHAVLRHLRREGVELPYQVTRRGLGTRLAWNRPRYDAIYQMLINPLYAGVYCFGKRRSRFDAVNQRRHVERVARDAWEVFLRDHHPGYLSYAQHEENMERLRNNRYQFEQSQGAPREGGALLQGLVYCQRCGARMRVRYQHGAPYYCCDWARRRFADPVCGWASAKRVDTFVAELVLGVLNAGTVELSLAHEQALQEEDARMDRQWREKLQRLEYEVNLARRRYELVDPANRLVAQTLETEWNDALSALDAARQEYQRRERTAAITSTVEQMRQVVAHLPDYWNGDDLDPRDKKEIIRCLIEQVNLRREDNLIKTEVVWTGGARSALDVPKYLFTPGRIYHRVRELAQTHTDAEIATLLNAEGTQTVKGKPWTARRVMDFRCSNGIPSGTTASPLMRQTSSGYLTSAEVAELLGVHQSAIQRWFRCGVIDGKQDTRQSQLWIRWSEEVAHRLSGGAPFDSHMVSVRQLCAVQERRPDEILTWAHAEGHRVFRLRRGTTFRFYILPRPSEQRPD